MKWCGSFSSVLMCLCQTLSSVKTFSIIINDAIFHWLNKIPAGKTWQDSRTSNQAHRGRYNSSAETHLKFERLHIIGAGSEVSVDQSAPTERSTVRVLLQSHAVPLAVATVQTLSVTTYSVTVIEFPFFCLPTCMLAYFRKSDPAYLRFIGLDFVFSCQNLLKLTEVFILTAWELSGKGAVCGVLWLCGTHRCPLPRV